MKKLNKLTEFSGVPGPVLAIVMDGIGIAESNDGNAISRANTPTLDMLAAKYPCVPLRAHGMAVGLPSDDDMGNSEVGHNALGAGQVFAQGAKLVSRAIETGTMFASETWREMMKISSSGAALHFIGLLSDGNVHSHISHLNAMLTRAKSDGACRVRLHILLDGRDVGEVSALDYVRPLEETLIKLNDGNFDGRIASGGGRMKITMDRYEADWSMVERGWRTHVLGEGRGFASAEEAIETYRREAEASGARVIDQDLPPFVITGDGVPVGTINDGDGVILFNFRGDRAIEISRAFESGGDFDKFDRVRVPKIIYAGILEYDGDLHIPARFLVQPPEIKNTMSEYLAGTGIAQYAVSETQKYGHVTYFWNGNRSGKFSDELETYVEITSDTVPFEQRPWMKCAEITDKLIEAIQSGKYKFIRANFPNGDMVGHTGNIDATIIAVESLDLQLGRILAAIDEAGGAAIITADHGNADEMYELDKKGNIKMNKNGTPSAKTSHTLNKVPCYFYDNKTNHKYKIKSPTEAGLSNAAATLVNLMGYESPPEWDDSLIDF